MITELKKHKALENNSQVQIVSQIQEEDRFE